MREYLLSVLALCAIASAPAAAAAGFEPEKTYAVIAGVLEWPSSAGLTPYAKENRKDRELFETLARSGVPTNQMMLLLDEAATLEGMQKALSNVLERATPDSTFVFYFRFISQLVERF